MSMSILEGRSPCEVAFGGSEAAEISSFQPDLTSVAQVLMQETFRVAQGDDLVMLRTRQKAVATHVDKMRQFFEEVGLVSCLFSLRFRRCSSFFLAFRSHIGPKHKALSGGYLSGRPHRFR